MNLYKLETLDICQRQVRAGLYTKDVKLKQIKFYIKFIYLPQR